MHGTPCVTNSPPDGKGVAKSCAFARIRMPTWRLLRTSSSRTVCHPRKKRVIELACEQAEAAGIVQLNEDEAGPYQAIPQPGAKFAARRPPGFAATRVRAGRDRQTADALSSGHRQDPRQRGGLSDQCRLASLAQRANRGGLGRDRKSPATRNAPP